MKCWHSGFRAISSTAQFLWISVAPSPTCSPWSNSGFQVWPVLELSTLQELHVPIQRQCTSSGMEPSIFSQHSHTLKVISKLQKAKSVVRQQIKSILMCSIIPSKETNNSFLYPFPPPLHDAFLNISRTFSHSFGSWSYPTLSIIIAALRADSFISLL